MRQEVNVFRALNGDTVTSDAAPVSGSLIQELVLLQQTSVVHCVKYWVNQFFV